MQYSREIGVPDIKPTGQQAETYNEGLQVEHFVKNLRNKVSLKTVSKNFSISSGCLTNYWFFHNFCASN